MSNDDETAGDVFTPPAVVFDLSRARVDDMARSVAGLLDPQEARLLEPQLRAEHREVVEQIYALAWNEPALVIDRAMELLKFETRPGRLIDPADDHADVPWTLMLVRLGGVPVLGARAARTWFAHLYRLRTEDVPVSSLTEAVAAYAVAAYEHLRGRHHEVERWSLTAALQTDLDERAGLGAVAFIRAARLLEPVLRPGSTFRS